MQQLLISIDGWLNQIDPGTHRRIKGLRLVTAFGLATLLATVPQIAHGHTTALGPLAAGFALWASVSEGRTTRYQSACDLALLCIAAGIGAVSLIILAPILGPDWSELTLISGSFCVGFLRKFDILGTGIGSQIFIGQLLAYNVGAKDLDAGTVALAVSLAILASVVPRLLSGPAEQPAIMTTPATKDDAGSAFSGVLMGAQAATASLSIVILGHFVGLTQSAWAIAACTYVVADSTWGTIDRVCRRIVGTSIGVPLAVACLPFAAQAPLGLWVAAATAMVIYAIALPENYHIASGAYAFALIVTMGASGEYSLAVLLARLWETVIGCAIGLIVLLLVTSIPRWSRRYAPHPQ
jgi:Fusaric acid resistance protein-like